MENVKKLLNRQEQSEEERREKKKQLEKVQEFRESLKTFYLRTFQLTAAKNYMFF